MIKSGTATSSFTGSGDTDSHVLVPANPNRLGLHIFNGTAQAVNIAFASTATGTNTARRLATAECWVMPEPIYTGPIAMAMVTADPGNGVQFTELT